MPFVPVPFSRRLPQVTRFGDKGRPSPLRIPSCMAHWHAPSALAIDAGDRGPDPSLDPFRSIPTRGCRGGRNSSPCVSRLVAARRRRVGARALSRVCPARPEGSRHGSRARRNRRPGQASPLLVGQRSGPRPEFVPGLERPGSRRGPRARGGRGLASRMGGGAAGPGPLRAGTRCGRARRGILGRAGPEAVAKGLVAGRYLEARDHRHRIRSWGLRVAVRGCAAE